MTTVSTQGTIAGPISGADDDQCTQRNCHCGEDSNIGITVSSWDPTER